MDITCSNTMMFQPNITSQHYLPSVTRIKDSLWQTALARAMNASCLSFSNSTYVSGVNRSSGLAFHISNLRFYVKDDDDNQLTITETVHCPILWHAQVFPV